jgi:hypothetical protein
MPRKRASAPAGPVAGDTAPGASPELAGTTAEADPEPTFREVWDHIEPGARMVRGVYSIYKTAEGGMHIAYRPEGTDEDQHRPVPPAMMAMMLAASEGKGPLGRFRALVGGFA